VENKDLIEPDTYNLYLKSTADEFGTHINKLSQWKMRQTHSETYKCLKAFLQRAKMGKRYRLKWYFTKTCSFCGFIKEFNGKFLTNTAWIKVTPIWLCDDCADFDLDMHMPD
jgi:hypothetical protein